MLLVRGEEASADEKDPCSSAPLARLIGQSCNVMCSCGRSIVGLCYVGIGKWNGKQVRREGRTDDSTLFVHDRLSDCARQGAYLAHPQNGFKEVRRSALADIASPAIR
jgi:hypothetical protein